MKVVEVIIIIIIIAVIWMIYTANRDTKAPHVMVVNCPDHKSKGKSEMVVVESSNPATIAERVKMSSYSSPGYQTVNNLTPVETMDAGSAAGAMCGADIAKYGDYNEYIRDISIDAQSQADHKQFVKDRMQNTQMNITGMSWPSDEFIYEPIPWVGLNRPRNVPYGNPTEVADVDHGMYENSRRIRL